MRYLDVSELVVSHDTGYDITIYPDIQCDITPDHPKAQGKNNVNETDYLVAVHVLLWLLVSALFLPCLPPGLFCRPSVAHQMDTS